MKHYVLVCYLTVHFALFCCRTSLCFLVIGASGVTRCATYSVDSGVYTVGCYFTYAEDRRTRNLYEKLATKTCAHPGYPISVRKLSHVIASFSHQIECLFDARNSHEKNLAASRYDTRTSFSCKLTRASFSYKFLVRLSSALFIRAHSVYVHLANCYSTQ